MSIAPVNDCWNRIGVQGDKSCSELPRNIHCRNCPVFEQSAHALLDREAPAGYVEEWTQLLAREKEVEARFTDAVLVFRIGAEWLALPARRCMEIVGLRPIRRIPHRSNQILLGLTSVRGELLLCFSLAALLGLEPAANTVANARPRLIVAREGQFGVTMPVDEVMGVLRFHKDTVQAIPATVAHAVPQFSRGMLAESQRKIGLLDEDLIFHAFAKGLA